MINLISDQDKLECFEQLYHQMKKDNFEQILQYVKLESIFLFEYIPETSFYHPRLWFDKFKVSRRIYSPIDKSFVFGEKDSKIFECENLEELIKKILQQYTFLNQYLSKYPINIELIEQLKHNEQ